MVPEKLVNALRLRALLDPLLNLIGFRLLNRQQTAAFLKPFRVLVHPEFHVALPKVTDVVDKGKVYFRAKESRSETGSVWMYDREQRRATLLPYGAVRTAGKVLCTDFNNRGAIKGLFLFPNRKPQIVPTVIAPWTQVLDGYTFGGYYDFMVFVAAKLCRMKESLPEAIFNEAMVSYPLFNTTYEREFLELLGISPQRLFDSRFYKLNFNTCILGDSGHWFYPNQADILALKRAVQGRFPATTEARKRIYVSRMGRRRVINEAELIRLLAEYGFEIIEDKFRSLSEQVSIYSSASFVLGPHGASFTNIVWCQPGTRLFELFSPNYVPDFFLYLARLLGIEYAAYCQGPLGSGDWSLGLEENIHVSIPELKERLDVLLGAPSMCDPD